MIIEQPAKWLRWLYPRATWRMDKNEKAVYLTFDDGPIPESTPFVLETLAKYNAHATFFVVGDNVLKYPTCSERLSMQGIKSATTRSTTGEDSSILQNHITQMRKKPINL